MDSLCEGKVSFVFFFQSADVKELRYILRRDGFSLPVCIDADDSFNSLNHFPGEMMFQTFLVDSENRVKVIGNPIHNLIGKGSLPEGTDWDEKQSASRYHSSS